jgi:O-antigen ligase
LIWHLILFSLLFLPLFPTLGAFALGIALLLTWSHQYKKIIKVPLNWGFFLLGIWLILTSCIAYQPKESFLGLANFLPFFALLAANGVVIRKFSQLKQLAWAIVIPSFPIGILGLGQMFLNWRIPWTILGWELVAKGNPEGRMSSVFIYTNNLAAYLLIAFILGLGLGIITCQNWHTSQSSKKSWLLGFLALTIVIDALGILLTSSRNAWAIAVLACIAFALYLGWRSLVLAFFGFVSAIGWASFGINPSRDWLRGIVPAYFWARLSDQMYPDRPIPTLRSSQWKFAAEMIAQKPLTGWGLRSFSPLYEQQTGFWFGHPHNILLMLTAETGIVGAIIFLGLVGWIVAGALILLIRRLQSCRATPRRRENNLILFAYLLAFAGCTFFNLLDLTIFDLRVNTLGWFILSGIAIADYRGKTTETQRTQRF